MCPPATVLHAFDLIGLFLGGYWESRRQLVLSRCEVTSLHQCIGIPAKYCPLKVLPISLHGLAQLLVTR